MLILDEVLRAADRGLVDPEEVVALAESKPETLELVLTGSHGEPDYLDGVADLITNVRKDAPRSTRGMRPARDGVLTWRRSEPHDRPQSRHRDNPRRRHREPRR